MLLTDERGDASEVTEFPAVTVRTSSYFQPHWMHVDIFIAGDHNEATKICNLCLGSDLGTARLVLWRAQGRDSSRCWPAGCIVTAPLPNKALLVFYL